MLSPRCATKKAVGSGGRSNAPTHQTICRSGTSQPTALNTYHLGLGQSLCSFDLVLFRVGNWTFSGLSSTYRRQALAGSGTGLHSSSTKPSAVISSRRSPAPIPDCWSALSVACFGGAKAQAARSVAAHRATRTGRHRRSQGVLDATVCQAGRLGCRDPRWPQRQLFDIRATIVTQLSLEF